MPVFSSRRTLTWAAAFSGLAGFALADQSYVVTSLADDGAGSLRAALDAAATATAPVTIVILPKGTISISKGLVYSGTQPLAIYGTGQVISAERNVTVLAVTQGADLSLRQLSFIGPGGFDINARGDIDGPAGKGVFVDLREDQIGTVTVLLDTVFISRVAGHGLHISDCTLADACGGGGGGRGEGSAASIALRIIGSEIVDVGHGSFDADGVRVDERGPGDIHFSAAASRFADVGADGVELDEGQDGSVLVDVVNASFDGNGYYCDPDLLFSFMPAEPNAAFDKGAQSPDGIPGPVTGSPDDRCFEYALDLYGDGSVEEYEITIDVDDGFDVDEAGPGDIRAHVVQSAINDNYDEGLDFDEEDAGDIRLTLFGTLGRNNTDDAFKSSESGRGDVIATVVEVVADGNGGVGVVFEEEDNGNVSVNAQALRTMFNDGGDLGLEVIQDDKGAGELVVIDSQLDDGVEVDGVTYSR